MSTAPYSPEVATLVQQSHAQRVTARATTGFATAFAPIADLDLLPGSTLDFDETRSPRVTANLLTPAQSQDVIDALDPRLTPRAQITHGYRLASGAWDDHLAANLQLRRREILRPDNVIRLTCTSDEATIIDAESFDQPAAGDPETVDAVDVMTTWLPQWFVVGDEPVVTATVSPKAVSWDSRSGDTWGQIVNIADELDADIYDDGLRRWWFTPRRYVASVADVSLTVGANGTILRSNAATDRGDWANFASVLFSPDPPRYLQPSGNPDVVLGWASVQSGPYRPALVGSKNYNVKRVGYPSQAAANAVAATLLRRMLSRARSLTLDAVACWWLRPGDTITVQLPEGPPERVLVSAVSFDLAEGRMTVTTRTPDDASTIAIGA